MSRTAVHVLSTTLLALSSLQGALAFVTPHNVATTTTRTLPSPATTTTTLSTGNPSMMRMMVDPVSAMDGMTAVTTSAAIPAMQQEMASLFSSTNLLSFTDQGQNLAGIFFQASLLPYLLFLYFLSFRGNRIPDLGNFGFQFVLLFVLSTIPSGIISKAVYGQTLANVDYLHGGAELLLTTANVFIVSKVV